MQPEGTDEEPGLGPVKAILGDDYEGWRRGAEILDGKFQDDRIRSEDGQKPSTLVLRSFFTGCEIKTHNSGRRMLAKACIWKKSRACSRSTGSRRAGVIPGRRSSRRWDQGRTASKAPCRCSRHRPRLRWRCPGRP